MTTLVIFFTIFVTTLVLGGKISRTIKKAAKATTEAVKGVRSQSLQVRSKFLILK
jgi:hypothetical protein